jgi:hypothetical protein
LADSFVAHHFLRDAMRPVFAGYELISYKRTDKDGSMRRERLTVIDLVKMLSSSESTAGK